MIILVLIFFLKIQKLLKIGLIKNKMTQLIRYRNFLVITFINIKEIKKQYLISGCIQFNLS